MLIDLEGDIVKFSVTGILIVIIMVLFVIRGCKIGLIKAIFDLLSFFIVGLFTWLLYPYVASWIIKTPLYHGIHNWLMLTLKDNNIINESLPEFFINLPNFIKDSIVVSSKRAFDNLITSTVDALTILTINVISIIVLFVALIIISIFVKKLGSKINNIIIIGPINKILGAMFGFVQGIFVVYLVVMIISYFPTTKLYNFMANDMESSLVCSCMFNENTKILGFKPSYPVLRSE